MSLLGASVVVVMAIPGIRCANAPPYDARTEIERKGGEEHVFASDLVGDSFSEYQWRLDAPEGSVTALSAAEGNSTSFVPDRSGLYVVELTFSDEDVEGKKRHAFELLDDSFSVTLTAPEQVVQGALVVATATAHDPAGEVLDVRWELAHETGAIVPFTTLDQDSVQFLAAESGYYRIEVSVEDELGDLRTERTGLWAIED